MAGSTVDFSVTGDSQKALAEMQKVIKKQDQLIRKMGATSKQTKRGARDNAHGMRSWVKGLGAVAAGYLSVSAAAGGVMKILREMQQLRERDKGRILGAEMAERQLVQQAMGDPKQAARLLEMSRSTANVAGIDRSRAAQFTEQLSSLGLLGDRKIFEGLFDVTKDPTRVAEGVATISKAFEGGDPTGSTADMVNKLFRAAAPSKVPVDRFAQAVVKAAASSKQLRATDEEMLAAASVITQVVGEPNEAGTSLRSFAAKAARLNLGGGRGIMAAVEDVRGRGLSAAQLQQLLGTEAMTAYDTLASRAGATRRLQGQITAAQGSDLYRQIVQASNVDPQLSAAKRSRVAPLQGDAITGTRTLTRQATRDATVEHLRRVESGFDALMFKWADQTAEFFGSDPFGTGGRQSVPVEIVNDRSGRRNPNVHRETDRGGL